MSDAAGQLEVALDGFDKFLVCKDLCPAKQRPHLVRWVRDFLSFAREHGGYTFEQALDLFLAEVARRGHVSRARMTQIMNLLLLAPDIQEEILFLPRKTEGRCHVIERSMRATIAEPLFANQRHLWRGIRQGVRLA